MHFLLKPPQQKTIRFFLAGHKILALQDSHFCFFRALEKSFFVKIYGKN